MKKFNRLRQTQLLADLSLLLVAIVWGSSYLATKNVLEFYPIFLFLFIRFSVTVIFMLPFTWKELHRASKETWLAGGIFGVFLFGIFSFETIGINFTSAANAGFLISLTVILTPLVESAVFKKSPGWGLTGAILLSFTGAAFLTLREGYHFNIGDLFILAAALTRATQMTYTQKLTLGKKMDSGALTTIQLGVVAIATGIVAFNLHDSQSFIFPTSPSIWLLILYLSLVGTLFAFYIQLVMIRKTSPTRVGLLMGTEPVFAAIFAVFIGGETLGLLGWIGGLLIVIATYYGRYLETKRRLKEASVTI